MNMKREILIVALLLSGAVAAQPVAERPLPPQPEAVEPAVDRPIPLHRPRLQVSPFIPFRRFLPCSLCRPLHLCRRFLRFLPFRPRSLCRPFRLCHARATAIGSEG